MSETETRVGHCKADETDHYAGRGSDAKDMTQTEVGERGWLGNPFAVDDHSRSESISLYREEFERRLVTDSEFRSGVASLAGSVLGCWCQRLDDDSPRCHAEIVAEWADRLAGGVDDATDATVPELLHALEPRRPRVIDTWERDDGTARAVVMDGGGPTLGDVLPHSHYYVPARCPLGAENWVPVRGRRDDQRERRLRLYGILDERHDIVRGAYDDGVPASVAFESVKAVAAFQWAVRKRTVRQIADTAGLAESTIRQYVSDYLAGRTE